MTLQEIRDAVARYYHLKTGEILMKRRVRRIARPRQVAIYLCRELTERSYPEIILAFGLQNHTTAWYACQHISALETKNPEVAEDIANLRRILTETQPPQITGE